MALTSVERIFGQTRAPDVKIQQEFKDAVDALCKERLGMVMHLAPSESEKDMFYHTSILLVVQDWLNRGWHASLGKVDVTDFMKDRIPA